MRKNWNKFTVLNSMKALAKKLGRTPKQRDDISLMHACIKYYGTWSNAQMLSGISPNRKNNPAEIRRLYLNENMTSLQIAKRFRITKAAVLAMMKRHNIPRRPPGFKYNGRYKTGKSHPNWKGGRIMSRGYIFIHIPGTKRIFEHRLVMQQKLGRVLLRNEHIHHLNGIKDDNRLENLALLSKREHHKLGPTLRNLMSKRILELEKTVVELSRIVNA